MSASILLDQDGLSPPGVAGQARSDGLANGAWVYVTNASGQPCRCEFWWVPPDDDEVLATLEQVAPNQWRFKPKAGCRGEYAPRIIEAENTDSESDDIKAFGIRTAVAGLLIPALNSRGDYSVNLASSGGDKTAAARISFQNEPLPDNAEINWANWWQAQRELVEAVETLYAASPASADGVNVFTWEPLYAGSSPNVYSTFALAYAAALACDGPARIVMQIGASSTFSIPVDQVYDGEDRMTLVAPQTGATVQLSFGAATEFLNWAGVIGSQQGMLNFSAAAAGPNATFFRFTSPGCVPVFKGQIAKLPGSTLRSLISIVHSNPISNARTLMLGRGVQIDNAGDVKCDGRLFLHFIEPEVLTAAGAVDDSPAHSQELTVVYWADYPLAATSIGSTWAGPISELRQDEAIATAYDPATPADWPEGAPIQVADALDKLAARDDVASGIYIWDIGGTLPDAPNVFLTWAEVHAAATTFSGTCDILLFSEDDNQTFTIPAGSWEMDGDIGLLAWGNNYTLAFAIGSELRNLRRIDAGTVHATATGIFEAGTKLNITDLESDSYPAETACINQTDTVGQGLYLRNVVFGAHTSTFKHYVAIASGEGMRAQVVVEGVDFNAPRVVLAEESVNIRMRGTNNRLTRSDCFTPVNGTGEYVRLVLESGGDQERSLSSTWDTSWTGAGGTSSIDLNVYGQRVFYNAAASGADWSNLGGTPENVQDALTLMSGRVFLKNGSRAMTGNLDLGGNIIRAQGWDVRTSTLISTDQDNWSPSSWDNADEYRVALNADVTFTGFAAPTGTGTSRKILKNNSGGFRLKIPHNSGSSSAGNKVNTPNSYDFIVPFRGSVQLDYDFTSLAWSLTTVKNEAQVWLTPAQITATQDDYGPTASSVLWADATHVRLSSDAARTITGLVAPASTNPIKRKFLMNINTDETRVISIADNGGSASANVVIASGPGPIRIPAGGGVWVEYDDTSARWRAASIVARNWQYVLSPATVSSTQDDYGPTNFTGATFVRVTLSGSRTFTGFAKPSEFSGTDDKIVFNTSTTDSMNITHDDSGSSADNRVLTPDGLRFVVPPLSSARLWYDRTTLKWRPVSRTGFRTMAIQVFTAGSSTYTPTTGMRACIVILTGGGGGGGGADTDGTNGAVAVGACGAGAGTAIGVFTASAIGTSQPIVIGTGGPGGSTSGGNGTAGNDSTFGTGPLMTATAGPGGDGSGANVATKANFVGGAAGGTPTGGTVNIRGGSSASSCAFGDNATFTAGITGAPGGSFWGTGASSRMLAQASISADLTSAGGTASVPGTGGGGGVSLTAGTGVAGGVGADGIGVIIEFVL